MKRDLILAFDTASDNIALAVGRLSGDTGDDTGAGFAYSLLPIASNDHPALRQANVQLIPSIDVLLQQADLSADDIGVVVCGLGPGSFTGVRIGVATAKGIARGLGVPLYGVSTLDAVAWGAWKAGLRGRIGVIADAMRKEVYPARFDLTDAGAKRLDAHTVTKAETVAANWESEKDSIRLIGDGLKKYAEVFIGGAADRNEGGQEATCCPSGTNGETAPVHPGEPSGFTLGDPELWIPKGEGLLLAFQSAHKLGNAGSGDAATLLPIYTRLSDAEENERKRLAMGGQIAQGALVEVPKSGVADPARLEQVNYRPMAASDIAAVALLESAVFPDASSTSGERWSENMFAGELGRPDRSWWVAYVGDRLVGFAGGWVVDGDLQVLDIATAFTHRGRGIARELLGRLLQDGKDLGATTTSLEVRESNVAAIALYESSGYERVGLRPDYYSPMMSGENARREAAVIMRKTPVDIGGYDSDEGVGSNLLQVDREPSFVRSNQSVPTILAIETSCDETAVAVIDGSGRLLSNTIASQIDFHSRFGGVVPEIASRKHTEAIVGVLDATLEEAGITSWKELDALAVTYAPGLIGALVVGVAFAKGLSWATGLPLIRVNHLEGHIYANRFVNDTSATIASAEHHSSAIGDEERDCDTLRPDVDCALDPAGGVLNPPFVIALLSGGHTMLVHVRDWGNYRILGQSLDDAVGETFDKVAKALGLGYPGGPIISNLADQGDATAIRFPRALIHSHDYMFSLSGLKTAVITYIRNEQEAGNTLNIPDVAASFQQAVIDVQVAKALAALEETGCTTFCMGGGVAANRTLREAYKQALEAKGVRVIYPPTNACTDNAAMIALVAIDRFRSGNFMPPDGDAHAQADLEQAY